VFILWETLVTNQSDKRLVNIMTINSPDF